MRINKLISIFILLSAWCYAKSLFFHNSKLFYIIFTNQKMENEERSSLAMTIDENHNISNSNIDEFLYFKSDNMNQFDKNKTFGSNPRYRFLENPCYNCSPDLIFDIDYKFKPDEKDKIFFCCANRWYGFL